MAKTYRLGRGERVANTLFAAMTRLGLGARYRGRRSGLARSTPVDVMTTGGERYLVAPYGEVNWVWNLRAAGHLTLTRRGNVEAFTAEEIHGGAAAPVIRAYLHQVPVTRAYWDVDEHAGDAELAAQTDRHPVFRLTAKRPS